MKNFFRNVINIISFLYQNTVYLIFAFFIVWLTLLSAFSTSFLNNATEHTYFVKDNVWINLGVLIFLIVLMTIFYRSVFYKLLNKKLEDDHKFKMIKFILIGLIFFICFFIALSAQTIPHADFMEVMKSAYELKNGNYTRFDVSGYVGTYPHQIGIIVFLYAFSHIFGDFNYFAFQVLNAASIAYAYKVLADISDILGINRISQLGVLVFGIFFLPYNIFVTFIYGTIIGLTLALVAIKNIMIYIKRPKIKYASISAVCIVLSTIFKSNYLIIMIAILIYVFIELLKSDSSKKLFLIGYIVLALMLKIMGGGLLEGFISNKVGHPIGKGASSWSWIAMGLQDNTNKANGWYNGYNLNTYRENEYNNKKQELQAKAYINERIKYFIQNKMEAVSFFSQKFASQWNDPNFESFNILYQQGSNIHPPNYIQYIKKVDGSDKLTKIYSVFHFCIMFGCMFYIFFDSDKKNRDYILIQMILVGGFLFHMLWEAKTLYVLPYFVILAPLSIKGYSSMLYQICENKVKIQKGKYFNQLNIYYLTLVIIIIFIYVSNSKLINSLIKLDIDTSIYNDYVMFNTTDKLIDGDYSIYSYMNEDQILYITKIVDEKSANIGLINKIDGFTENIEIKTSEDKVHFNFKDTGLSLDLNGNKEIENGIVQAWQESNSNAQKWVIKRDGKSKDVYFILIGSKSALTYDNESNKICIKQFSYSDNQKWIIK